MRIRRVALAATLAVSIGGCGQLGGDTRYAGSGSDPVTVRVDAPAPSPVPAAPPAGLGPDELPL